MKYIVIIGDGMSDYPVPELGNKTPLQCARKPNIDSLAKLGVVGMVKTIPDGMSPGSDTANLSVMGYNPRLHYTGRSPLEAVSMGINLDDTDIAFRCNLVTLSDEPDYSEKIMVDYSSDEISSEEAAELINEINKHFRTDSISFYPGVSYRHCMVWKNGPSGYKLTPPHDILEKKIGPYLPSGSNSSILCNMMRLSYEILKVHPVNAARISKGLRPANSIWLWGEGRKLVIPEFRHKFGLDGAVISAVDLIKGIGVSAGLKPVNVQGATGNIHTNFLGKAEAALNELKSGKDFVYIHIEAPDECGHRYEIENKVKSIELIDELVVSTIVKGLEAFKEYSILILPDHPTPLSLRTHTAEPVPFLIYRNGKTSSIGVPGYDEKTAGETGLFIEEGHTLLELFINGNI